MSIYRQSDTNWRMVALMVMHRRGGGVTRGAFLPSPSRGVFLHSPSTMSLSPLSLHHVSLLPPYFSPFSLWLSPSPFLPFPFLPFSSSLCPLSLFSLPLSPLTTFLPTPAPPYFCLAIQIRFASKASITVMILSFRTDMPGHRAVWSGYTLFAIPSVPFGLITLW